MSQSEINELIKIHYEHRFQIEKQNMMINNRKTDNQTKK
jgi:hypothetical protein